jgi:hypothetical protein
VLAAGPLGTGLAAAGDGERLVTSAEAVVTVDKARVFDDAFRVADFEEDVLDAGNYAFAHAKGCEGCQAVALSYQIVLVQEPPEVVTPENLAVSLNEACDSCVAAAGAYQFVVGGEPVRLTWTGWWKLGSIRYRVAQLEDSGLTGPEMVAQADALADEIRAVLKTELRRVDGDEHRGRGHVEERRVHDKGHEGRSEEHETYELDD